MLHQNEAIQVGLAGLAKWGIIKCSAPNKREGRRVNLTLGGNAACHALFQGAWSQRAVSGVRIYEIGVEGGISLHGAL